MDRIDPELGHSIFHPDATADYGDYYWGTGYGVIDAICESHRHSLSHSHQITTMTIEVNGNRAGSEAYIFATVRAEQNGKLIQYYIWARYLDSWSRRGGNWGIDHRQVIHDLDEVREVTPMSLTGYSRRDSDCPSYAVLRP